jgi:opacity protein-like surface antigen
MLNSKSVGTFRLALASVAVVLASAVLAAQATPPVKDIKKQLVLTQDVKVGTTVLSTGRYQVSSKNQELTFRRLRPDPGASGQWIVDSGQKPVLVKCTISALDAKSDRTTLEMAPGNGVPMLSSLTLEGTSIKFTIVP